MSYVTVWIRAVWSTKNRQPVLTKEIRTNLYPHIINYGRDKGIWIDIVNGYTAHVHYLFSLNKEQTIAKTMQLLKGESAHWLNESGMCKERINWQDDYFAVSIGQS